MSFRLQEFREAAGLTKTELARRSGVTDRTVRNIENGVHQPSIVTAAKLSIALGVTVDKLLAPEQPVRT